MKRNILEEMNFNKMKKVIIIGIFFLCSFLNVAAQEKGYVEKTLDRLRLKYTDLERKCYVNYHYTDTDTYQKVFVNKYTDTYLGLEVREVYSLIYESTVKPSADLLSKLLYFNGTLKFGGFKMEKYSSGKYVIYMSVKIDANANLELFQDALKMVGGTATDMESKLFNRDKF